MVFINLLKQTGIKIDTAAGGEEALSKAFDKKYDIIFLDHMMPGKDGIQTFHELRSRKDSPNLETPVICLTANAISGAREKYLEEGFDDYLTKPINSMKLENMLIDYLPEEKIIRVGSDAQILPVTDTEKIIGSVSDEEHNGEQKSVTPVDTEELPVIFGLDWNVAMMHLQEREILDTILEEFFLNIDQHADSLNVIALIDRSDEETMAVKDAMRRNCPAIVITDLK